MSRREALRKGERCADVSGLRSAEGEQKTTLEELPKTPNSKIRSRKFATTLKEEADCRPNPLPVKIDVLVMDLAAGNETADLAKTFVSRDEVLRYITKAEASPSKVQRCPMRGITEIISVSWR